MAVKNKKSLLMLFALSAVCSLYGLGTAYIEMRFSPVAVSFGLLGGAGLVLCVFMFKRQTKEKAPVQNRKKLGFVVFIVFLFLALTVGINYVTYITNIRWDLTQSKQHTLAKETHALIDELTEDVQITILHVGMPPKYLEDLLGAYERRAKGKIKTEIIDPLVQIGYAARFGNIISGREKKVVVRSGQNQRDYDFSDEPLSENLLNNAIVRVSRRTRQAYFLVGHGEYDIFEKGDTGFSTFNSHLLANNIIGQRLMLAVDGGIPDDCDVLVIAGAQDHLTEKEEKIIQEYLHKGGDALFLIEHVIITTPDRPLSEDEINKNPSLNSMLNEWGVHIANDVVVDLASHTSGDVGSPATRNYMPHKAITTDLDYTFYIRPRSISIVPDRRKTIKVAPVVLTASDEASWGEKNRTLEVKFDEAEDRAGPVPISYVMWEPKEEGETSDTRMIVFTDADFIANAYIGSYSNVKMGLNVINWLTETDYQTFTDAKEINVEQLDLTSRQKRQVAVMLTIVPVLIIIMGCITWITNRR